jgi:hypothetical protein
MRCTAAYSTTPVANPVDAAALAPRTHTPLMMPRPMRARSTATQRHRADSWNSLLCLTPTCSSRAPPRPTPSKTLLGSERAPPSWLDWLIRRRRQRAARGTPRRDASRRTCLSFRRAHRGAHRAAATRTRQRDAHAVSAVALCPRPCKPTRASARRRRQLCTRRLRRLARSALGRAAALFLMRPPHTPPLNAFGHSDSLELQRVSAPKKYKLNTRL